METFATIDNEQLIHVTGALDLGRIGRAAWDGAGTYGRAGSLMGAFLGGVTTGGTGILPGAGAGGLIGAGVGAVWEGGRELYNQMTGSGQPQQQPAAPTS